MPTPTCVIPSPAEFIQIGRKLIPNKRKDLLGLSELLPTKYVNNTSIVIKRPDILRGLQPWRGLGEEPPVNRTPFNRYGRDCVFKPGYWGETRSITEYELAVSAEPATSAENYYPHMPLDVKEEIARIQEGQTTRMLNRMEKSVWDALRTGRYLALDEEGQPVLEEFFAIRHVRAAVDWDDPSTSAPLATLRAFPEEFRDSSASFGVGTQYWMNRTTLNRILENRNQYDLGKLAQSACCNLLDLSWINGQLGAQGLGGIRVYDQKWVDDKDNIHLFIPDGYVIVVGTRPDTKNVGSYYLTKVLNNGRTLDGNDKGIWYFLKDNGMEQVTRKVVVGTGHNGGPIIEYPEMVISLQVF